MEISGVNLNTNLLSRVHQESFQNHQKIVLSYEEILQSELNRVHSILKGHTSEITGLAITSDNLFLISCGKDKTLRVWSLICRVEEQKHDINIEDDEWVSSITISPNDKILILVVSGKYLKIKSHLDFTSPGKMIKDSITSISNVSISGDSQHFCLVDRNSEVKVFDMNGDIVQTLASESESLNFALFAGEVILIMHKSGKIRAWNTSKSTFDYQLEENPSIEYKSGIIVESNRYLVLGNQNGKIVIWDLVEKLKTCEIEIRSPIKSLSYAKNSGNDMIVCIDEDNVLSYINLNSKSITKRVENSDEKIKNVLQTLDGRLLITIYYEKNIKIWEEGEGKFNKIPFSIGKNIKSACFDMSHHKLGVVYDNNIIKIFDLDEEKEIESIIWQDRKFYSASGLMTKTN